MSWLRRLACLVVRRGHVYRPLYEERCTSYTRKRWGWRYRWQVRYRCEHCGGWTRWMYRATLERFLARHQPRWGG